MVASKDGQDGIAKLSRKPTLREDPTTIRIQGFLKKRSPSWPHTWQKRYFVWYQNSNEIRYYKDMVVTPSGRFPLKERGSIPIETIQHIDSSVGAEYAGGRFDIIAKRYGKSSNHYPRSINLAELDLPEVSRKFEIMCAEAAQAQKWILHLKKAIGQGVGKEDKLRHVHSTITMDGGAGGEGKAPERTDGGDMATGGYRQGTRMNSGGVGVGSGGVGVGSGGVGGAGAGAGMGRPAPASGSGPAAGPIDVPGARVVGEEYDM